MSEAQAGGQGSLGRFEGAVISGVNESGYFLSLDWVRNAIRPIVGFDPYPGTLNLRLLDADALPRWRKIRRQAGVPLIPPQPGSCGGRLISALIGGLIPAAVVVSDVTRYGDEIMEIVAPVHLRTRLGLQDGDLVWLTIRPSFPRSKPHPEGYVMSYAVVGKSIGRVEGLEKVTGKARYAADLLLPGLLWGKLLRSPLPHARVIRIHADKARALPGVRAVLIAQDIPHVLVGRRMCDVPLLAPGLRGEPWP